MLKRPGAPKHNFITRTICFHWKCRSVIGWHRTQQRNKFKKYKKGPAIPRLRYLQLDSIREAEKQNRPIQPDTVPIIVSEPVKKDSVVAFTFNDVLFETNKSDLKREFIDRLDTLSDFLSKHSNYRIRVVGHTDNSGSEKENDRLSQDRAEAVAEYLASTGIDLNVITAEGMGSKSPVSDNRTLEGRQKNRRVEVYVSFQ
jgi:outer membrane protein OmpA-like peptidoglycan-associated protein